MIYDDALWDVILFDQRWEEDEKERLDGYKQRWEYYNGEHQQALAVRPGQPDDNVIINLTRFIVDKGVAFLFGKEPTFELQEGELTPEEELLEEVWQANQKMTFLSKVATTGGVFGHVFIKIVPDGRRTGIPRLVSIEPEYVRAYWDDADIESVWMYRIQWQTLEREGQTLKPVHKRQTIERATDTSWQITNEIAKAARPWQPDPNNPDMVWAYPWPPMIDAQNIPLPGVYYGSSDLQDLSDQDAINYLASKLQRIIRYHAHPKTTAGGMSNADFRIGTDDVLVLPGEKSWIKNLEMQSDLAGSIGFMDRLINWFLATSRIPRIDPAQINVGALSGFALQVLYSDLLEKTELKRRTYGDMLVELNRRLLEMAGKGDGNIATIHWPYPLPEDKAAEKERDAFELDYNLASIETVRSRRGLDNEVEEERISKQEVREGNVGAMLLRQFERGQ